MAALQALLKEAERKARKGQGDGAIDEILRELSSAASYWQSVPDVDAAAALEQVLRVQEEHLQQIHRRHTKPTGCTRSKCIERSDLLAILKTYTIVDMLTLAKPEQLCGGAKLPAFHHPWALRLLSVHGNFDFNSLANGSKFLFSLRRDGLLQTADNPRPEFDAAPLVAHGSWRRDLVAMRAHWLTRISKACDLNRCHGPLGTGTSADFFSFARHSLAAELNVDTGLHELQAIQTWVGENSAASAWHNAFNGTGDQLNWAKPDANVAAQLLGGTDNEGNFYRDRLKGFAAAMRSTFLLEVIRSTEPLCLNGGQPFGLGVQTGRKLKQGKLVARIGGNSIATTCAQGKRDGWGVKRLSPPITNGELVGSKQFQAPFEYTSFEVPLYPGTNTRFPRRRFNPNKLISPLDFPNMVSSSIGTQETRDLVGLSSVEGLQLVDTIGLFKGRFKGLVSSSPNAGTRERQELLTWLLLDDVGIFEATEKRLLERLLRTADVDKARNSGALEELVTAGVGYAENKRDARMQGLFGFLGTALHFVLQPNKKSLWYAGRLDRLIKDAANRTRHDQNDMRSADELRLFHFFRLLAYESCTKLTCKYADVGCRHAANFVISYDFVVAKDQWPQAVEDNPRFEHLRERVQDTFTRRLRRDLRTIMEDDRERQETLNLAMQQHAVISQVEHKDAWMPYERYPRYSFHPFEVSYDAITGSFQWGEDEGVVLAPPALRHDQIYKSIFGVEGENTTGITKKAREGHYTKKNSTRVEASYQFFLPAFAGTPTTVQAKFPNSSGWHQAFTGDKLKLPIGSAEQALAWVKVDKSFFGKSFFGKSCDKAGPHFFLLPRPRVQHETRAICSQSAANQQPSFLIFDNQQPTLTVKSDGKAHRQVGSEDCVLADKGSELHTLLERVEDPRYTLIFSVLGDAHEVLLPRVMVRDKPGLVFTNTSSSVGCLSCEALGGFGICKDGDPTTALGDFKQFLPLQKGTGATVVRGAWIPLGHRTLAANQAWGSLKSQSMSSDVVLEAPTELALVQSSSWKTKIEGFLYRETPCTVDNSHNCGELVPEGVQDKVLAAVHLASILLSERIYANASRALKYADLNLKAQIWSSDICASIPQMEMLNEMATFAKKNNDSSPDAAAVRLRAHCILRRQVDLKLVPNCANTQTEAKVNRSCDVVVKDRCQAMRKGTVPWLVSNRTDSMQHDLNIYHQNLNRVAGELRLSAEMHNILMDPVPELPMLSKRVLPPCTGNQDCHGMNDKYVSAVSKSATDKCLDKSQALETLLFSDSARAFKHQTTGKHIKGEHPAFIKSEDQHNLIITPTQPFTKAFPEEILVLHALMNNSTDIRSSNATRLAKMLGLSPQHEPTHFQLQQAATTLINLRYKYLISSLRHDDFATELLPELAVLSTLVQAAAGAGTDTPLVETWTREHTMLSHAVGVLKHYEVNGQFPRQSKELQSKLYEDMINASRLVWGKWIDRGKGYDCTLNPLSLDSDNAREYRKVGPMQLFQADPVVRPLPSITESKLYLVDENKRIAEDCKDVLARLKVPVIKWTANGKDIDHEAHVGFKKTKKAQATRPESPFYAGTQSSTSIIQTEFSKHNNHYKKFIDSKCDGDSIELPDNCDRLAEYTFELVDKAKMIDRLTKLKNEQAVADERSSSLDIEVMCATRRCVRAASSAHIERLRSRARPPHAGQEVAEYRICRPRQQRARLFPGRSWHRPPSGAPRRQVGACNGCQHLTGLERDSRPTFAPQHKSVPG